MTVKARMNCYAITPVYADASKPETIYGKTVKLSPVYSSDPANPNYSFSQATPSGSFEMFVTNPAAFDAFEVGKVYDIDIVEFQAPAAA